LLIASCLQHEQTSKLLKVEGWVVEGLVVSVKNQRKKYHSRTPLKSINGEQSTTPNIVEG